MESINIQHEKYKSYELTLYVRDKDGKLTEETKSIRTNNATELWEFWNKYQGKPKRIKRRKKRNKKERIPSAKEANKILEQIYKDGEPANNV